MPRLDPAQIRAEADALDLAEIDVLADTWADRVPHAEFDRLRREAPVFWHEEPGDTGFWCVTTPDLIAEISRDHVTYSSELGGTFIPTQPEEDLEAMRLSILNMDPPRHDRMRKLISAGFTPRQIRRLQVEIEEHAEAVVDEIISRGEVDIVHDIAARLPMEMICSMLGVPSEDWERMYAWSDHLVGWDDPEINGEPDGHKIAAMELFMYCNELVERRKVEPSDDILSALVHAEVDGDRLTEMELNLFFVTLVVAGNETTRNLISHGILALLDHPEQMEQLKNDLSLLPTATEEMLRWGSSITNFRRTATTDTVLGGQQIKAGDKVVVFYLAANFDEERFGDPYSFRVDRADNPHISFGAGGAHFCMGAHLARAEISAVTRQIVTRLDNLQLAGDPVRLRSDFINGLKKLPVTFTAVREPAAV